MSKRVLVWASIILICATLCTAMCLASTPDKSQEAKFTPPPVSAESITWEKEDLEKLLYFSTSVEDVETLEIGSQIKTVPGCCIYIDATTATFEIAEGQSLSFSYNAGENPFRVGDVQDIYVFLA